MIGKLQSGSRAPRQGVKTTPTNKITLGLIAGLVGTIVMDVLGIPMIVAIGGAPTLPFSIIGDTTAGFLSMLGVELAGGIPLGAAMHYGIGLGLGVLFVAIVSRSDAFRSSFKSTGLCIVFVELMSLPMLVGAAVILGMTAADTALWFGMSFLMHGIYGAVLGWVAHFGLRSVAGSSSGVPTR
jgi:hypothetical protein